LLRRFNVIRRIDFPEIFGSLGFPLHFYSDFCSVSFCLISINCSIFELNFEGYDHIETMSNLADIREEIFKDNAKRIIIKVKTKSLDSEDCRATAYRVVGETFPDWECDSWILFLAIQVWGDKIFINIDINHDDYNFETAHKDKPILPVYVLRKHRGNWILIRWPQEDEPLAAAVAELHRFTGYGAESPFLENHNSRIIYANPREILI
jgi:hypothetical protein